MNTDIIRGTTPLIKYTFKIINVTDISVAYLTIKQRQITLEKDLTDAIVDTDNNMICWRLTQEETLEFVANTYITVMLNWKTADGIRGASKKDTIFIDYNLKKGVI